MDKEFYKNMITQKTAKIIVGTLVLGIVSLGGVAAYAERDDDRRVEQVEKKIEKTLNQAERKLETFESRMDSAWGLHDDNKRAVTMQHDGTYRVSGVEVKSVNASAQTLTVEFFGFTREVSVAGAKLIGGGKTITLADFQVGDKLTGAGSFNPTTRAITVREVHNLSYRNRASSDIQTRIQELLEMVRKLQEQLQSLRR